MARNMVTRLGMSDLALALEGGSQEVFLGRDLMSRSEISSRYPNKWTYRFVAWLSAVTKKLLLSLLPIVKHGSVG